MSACCQHLDATLANMPFWGCFSSNARRKWPSTLIDMVSMAMLHVNMLLLGMHGVHGVWVFSVASSTQVGMVHYVCRNISLSVTDRCQCVRSTNIRIIEEPRQAHRNEDAAYPSSTSLARPLGISTSTCLTSLRNDDSCLLKQQSSHSHSLFNARQQETPDVTLKKSKLHCLGNSQGRMTTLVETLTQKPVPRLPC